MQRDLRTRSGEKHSRRTGSLVHWAATVAATMVLSTCLLTLAHAQTHTVQGRVTDAASGEGLPGANIVVEGTTGGTTTNVDGRYDLTVPSPDVILVFSFVGFEPQSIPVDGRSELNVALSPATLTGTDVVVVGYRVIQRQDLTGSVDVVDVNRLAELPTGTVARALQGMASGVTVVGTGQPGQQPHISIRGLNTFGNNQPLFVIDGVPTQDIHDLNPHDIETMQVLKDAGAASIYGARASNGVVIITTRRGRGELSISYDAFVGYQVPRRNNVWDILTPQGMADLEWMAQRNSGLTPSSEQYGSGPNPVLPRYILPSGAQDVDEGTYFLNPYYTSPTDLTTFNQIVRANHAGTDWYREIFSPAPITQNNLTVSGGSDMGNFLVSLGYLNQQGTLLRTHYERYSLRANTLFNITDNLRIGENLSISFSENPQSGVLEEGSAIGMSYRQQPIIPVYDIHGNFAGSAGSGMGNAHSPVAQRERTRNNTGYNNRLFGNVFMELDFLRNFMFRTSFGGNLSGGSWSSFQFPTYEAAENSPINQYNEGAWNNQNWTWTNTVHSRHVVGNHFIEAVAGTEAYRNWGGSRQGSARGYFSFDPNYTTLLTGETALPPASWKYADAILSLIGRLDYSYHNRYLLSFTIRRDGSSRFVRDQWGTFPSVTAGWRVSEESFMQNVRWLTDLKIRGGYGIMGNQLNVDPANPYTLFAGDPETSFYDLGGTNTSPLPGFRQVRIGNPAATWERNEDINFGLDFALFRGRLEGSVDYYQKNVLDLLFTPELPATAGAASPPARNIASMKNDGIDLSLRNSVNIGEVRLDSRLSFTSYNNRIVAIAEGVDYFDGSSRRFGGGNPIIRNEVGQPISSYFGYKIVGFWQNQSEIDAANAASPTGVYQTDAAPGRFRYADITGSGNITPDDRTFLGSPNPDFSYGLNLGFSYRNLDLSLFAYGVQGNQIWNQVKWWTDFYPSFQGAKSNTALYHSWRPDNPNARVAIQENEGSFSTNRVPNSYYVEDGSYLRLKNIQLGYTLPAHMAAQIGLRNVRVYAQAADVLTFTGYSGIDPEIGGVNVNNFGIDEGQYATPATYTFGVSISL